MDHYYYFEYFKKKEGGIVISEDYGADENITRELLNKHPIMEGIHLLTKNHQTELGEVLKKHFKKHPDDKLLAKVNRNIANIWKVT